MSYLNPWTFNGNIVDSEVLEEYCGFVYLITNNNTGKKYIGKKLLKSSRKKSVKGKKRKIRVVSESDWKTYYGSSNNLLDDLNVSGYTNVTREILRLCKSKGECSYFEAKYQFEYDVLLKPQEFYNSWIMVKSRRDHLKVLYEEKV